MVPARRRTSSRATTACILHASERFCFVFLVLFLSCSWYRKRQRNGSAYWLTNVRHSPVSELPFEPCTPVLLPASLAAMHEQPSTEPPSHRAAVKHLGAKFFSFLYVTQSLRASPLCQSEATRLQDLPPSWGRYYPEGPASMLGMMLTPSRGISARPHTLFGQPRRFDLPLFLITYPYKAQCWRIAEPHRPRQSSRGALPRSLP